MGYSDLPFPPWGAQGEGVGAPHQCSLGVAACYFY